MNSNRDWNYVRLIKKRDKSAMFKYKLIKSILEDLDAYMERQGLESIDNESTLLFLIKSYCGKRVGPLVRYFILFGTPFKKTITMGDISNWTFNYRWHRKLFYDEHLIYE